MIVLALDTALAATQLAVYDAERDVILAAMSQPMATGHAEVLLPLAEDCLRQAGLSYSAITRIGVTVGPGSFTGVRIALSAARAMALALAIPAIGITTLEALAAPTLTGDTPVLAAIDARRGEIYALLLAKSGEILIPPCLITPRDLALLLPPGPIMAVGSGTALIGPLHAAITISEAPVLPVIDVIARLAAKAGAGDRPPVPLYLRAPDAKPQAAILPGRP